MEMAENHPVITSSLLYSLASVQPHALVQNAMNRFSGFVLDYDDRPVQDLEIYAGEKKIHRFPVCEPSKDIHTHVPHMHSAGNCRFAFDFYVDGQVPAYTFKAVFEDRSRQVLFVYPVYRDVHLKHWLQKMNQGLAGIPRPGPDLIFLTQGIHDPDAYQNSIIPGMYNIKRYLGDAGVDAQQIQTVLDIGCGTGRLLVGWYLDSPQRNLWGCDINETLIAWASQHLPCEINLSQNKISPPLSYPSQSFDLIQMVSVFTHLSMTSQQEWVGELRRIVRPKGHLLVTLHGETYVRLFHPGKLNAFLETGYLEIDSHEEGSNAFGTYHTPGFTASLFDGFEILGFYPRGSVHWPEVIFPVAAFQDVYVLRRL